MNTDEDITCWHCGCEDCEEQEWTSVKKGSDGIEAWVCKECIQDDNDDDYEDEDKVYYQMAMYDKDGAFVDHVVGDTEDITDCFTYLSEWHYKMNAGFEYRITQTPKLTERQCDILGIEWTIKTLYEIKM